MVINSLHSTHAPHRCSSPPLPHHYHHNNNHSLSPSASSYEQPWLLARPPTPAPGIQTMASSSHSSSTAGSEQCLLRRHLSARPRRKRAKSRYQHPMPGPSLLRTQRPIATISKPGLMNMQARRILILWACRCMGLQERRLGQCVRY